MHSSSNAFRIRPYAAGDAAALRRVFFSSVHGLAGGHYPAAQLDAWAPAQFDAQAWARRMDALRPWVAEAGGQAVAYADLQGPGYIDHFYVAAECARRGAGTLLLGHLSALAAAHGLARIYADVSLNAEGFFGRHGFAVTMRRQVSINGMELANARMVKRLTSA